MFFVCVDKNLRKKYRQSVIALGLITPIVTAALLFAVAIAVYLPYFSIALLSLAFLVSVAHTWRVAYLVFGTRGEGHYFLTLWNLIDTLLANIFANVCVSMIVWTIGFIMGVDQFKFTPTTVSAWTALARMIAYTFNIMSGAGIVQEIPLTFFAELVLSIQSLINLIAIILVVAPGSMSALTAHTDEKPRT
jgi:hypothetical protein